MAVNPTYVSVLPAAYHIDNDGKEVMAVGTVGAADTYVTNGFAITPAQFGLQQILFVDLSPVLGHTLTWNAATGLIQAFSSAGNELVNASAALQNGKFNIRVFGK